MARGQIIALSVGLLMALAGIAGAIPNPAAVYCIDSGYEYEGGDCIFPDGSRCNAWEYYCGCEPDGIGCWPGEFNCDFPCGQLPCGQAGEHVLVSECCEGLIAIPPIYIYDNECNDTGMTGWTNICSDCGNGICEVWESRCNCPEDCSVPEPTTAPVADADGPYSIYFGDVLTLNADGSIDDDDDIVSYMWDLDDNGTFETDANDQEVFDVNYAYLQSLGLLVDNTYNIHLQVTDSEGQSDSNDTTLTILPRPALEVTVDIKPGSCPNPLNVKSSGVLPVAILGSEELDVNTIDAASIKLAGVDAVRHNFEDVATAASDFNDCNCTTVGPDGFIDLTLKFITQEIVEAIGEVNDGAVLELELTGVLFSERPLEGTDCILIRGKHKPHNTADINKDGKVDLADFAIFADNWLQSSIVED